MAKYMLGEASIEVKESFKGDTSGVPIVGLEHLTPGEVTLSAWDKDIDNTFTKTFAQGDILFGRRRAYLKKAALAPFDGICSGDITVIRANPDVLSPSLLPFLIQSEDLFDFAVGKSAGSLSPRVKWEHLKTYELILPSLEEQEKAAEVLWSIEDTCRGYNKLLRETDELVKSQFIEMFGDPNESEDTVSFETAFTIRDDLRKPINDSVRSEMHENATIPYYGANGQVDTINQYLMDCTAICLAEDCGAYGAGEESSYIITGKSWVNNHAHVLIPNDCCDINYAHAYFRILDMSAYVSGSTRLKLTQGKMKEIPIVLPSLDKQKQFATIVEQSDKSKFALQQSLKEARALQKKIVKENFIPVKER